MLWEHNHRDTSGALIIQKMEDQEMQLKVKRGILARLGIRVHVS